MPLSALLIACGSGAANLSTSVGLDGASADSDVNLAATAQAAAGAAGFTSGGAAATGTSALSATGGVGVAGTGGAPPGTLPPPAYDPDDVKALLEQTATSPDGRERLGLRLAIAEHGPNAPWLLAVANRGSEPLRVLFDLRTLSLEVQAPTPEPSPKNPKPKAPKPVTCALPKDVLPTARDPKLELVLEPGEAVVDAFDPRLYCFPGETDVLLAPGVTVVPRLGFAEKTKTVFRNGKREQQVIEQGAPFLAELAERKPPQPVGDGTVEPAPKSDAAAPFESVAVKQLLGPSITLGEAFREKPREPDPSPLALLLTRGSDAATEREATISVTLVNQSSRPETVFFRRELLRFELSGPTGLIECDPLPANRAPDRSAFRVLAPGERVSATSRLIELCPTGALGVPGLYLVFGRYESDVSGDQFGLAAFQGRVVSDEPALVRIRKGWRDLPAQREPLRVRIDEP